MPVGLPRPSTWLPRKVYTYDVAWILVLVALALVYSIQPAWANLPHQSFSFEAVVPLWVPWAGALGGVTISLVGVATHTVDWDARRYGYWHVSRPFLGAVCGTVAVLIVVLVLRSVAPPTTGGAYDGGGVAVLAVIAYVVGYREETFRQLVTKVVDVILAPGQTDAAASTVTLVPALVDFGTVGVGHAGTTTLHVFNAGADTVHVAASAVTVEPATSTVDLGSIADSDVAPSSSLALPVSWHPTSGGTLDVTLVVTTDNRRLTTRLKGVATPSPPP